MTDTPSVINQLKAMGYASPKPPKRGPRQRTEMKRTGFTDSKQKAARRTEAAFQRAVVDHARRLGWFAWHCYNPRWQSEAGFPDLMLCKDRLVFLELKVYYDNGKANVVHGEQVRFHDTLRDAGQEVYVVYDDADGWDLITRVLSDGRLTVA